jgi:hypothetical protein
VPSFPQAGGGLPAALDNSITIFICPSLFYLGWFYLVSFISKKKKEKLT